ncbi:MAG: hypothetical protein HYZ79_04410 [Candidatus Melainabacteria bacterium]|nr:hypothetical protein [Candidatus Melainabacteria bacterium]
MIDIAFLVSGNGGNLRFLSTYLELSKQKDFNICCVIADRECGALEFAREHKIRNYIVHYEMDNNMELKKILTDLQAAFIVTNIHKILDVELVNLYYGRLINLHYSLLPAFKGMVGDKSIKKALECSCKFIGSTVHYVSQEVDSGEIISQCAIPVDKSLSFSNIMDVVFRSGCLNLLNALYIASKMNGDINRQNAIVRFNNITTVFSPELRFELNGIDQKFWKFIQQKNSVI